MAYGQSLWGLVRCTGLRWQRRALVLVILLTRLFVSLLVARQRQKWPYAVRSTCVLPVL